MNLFSLLDLALKSDEVIEVLEYYDATVIYDFDRLHEDTPDVYWVTVQEAGFDLRFNQRQVLDTIYMYVLPTRSRKPIDPSLSGLPFYRNFTEAKGAFQANAVPFRSEAGGEGWIKGQFAEHAVHYEFNQDGELRLVTVMATDA